MRGRFIRCINHGNLKIVRAVSMTSKKCEVEKNKNESDVFGEMERYQQQLSPENPITRSIKILKNDMKTAGRKIRMLMGFNEYLVNDKHDEFFATHTDVLIIGGGAIGSSIAYWLTQRAPHAMHVTVIEKESHETSCPSIGGLCGQFSLPENIKMSLFGAEFLREIDKHLTVEGHPALDVHFQPFGVLSLESFSGAAQLEVNSKLQNKLGARNILLSPRKLQERFPWLDVSDVELGCLGLDNEGWFDAWSLRNAFKCKSINFGAEYVQGTVIGFEFRDQPLIVPASSNGKYEQLERVVMRMPNGEIKAIKFGVCVIAAGAFSGEIGRMARLGLGEGLLSIPLPIEPRKRYTYHCHCIEGPGIDTPLVIDASGSYFYRNGLGGNYTSGMAPNLNDEPTIDNLDIDYDFFNEKLWPLLSKRVPVFKNIKMKDASAGYYEFNTMDENGILGYHPYYHNLVLCCGFSAHGVQHAPAAGRAIMELLLDGRFRSIDLSRLNFDRLCLGEPLNEVNWQQTQG